MRARPELLLFLTALVVCACGDPPPPAPSAPPVAAQPAAPTLTMEELATEAADIEPELTEEETCAPCHEEIVAVYARKAMHNSIAPIASVMAGDGPETQLPARAWSKNRSGPKIALERRAGGLFQILRDPLGRPEPWHEERIDYVIGSGRAARSYLRWSDERLWMLGVTWYREMDAVSLSPGPYFEAASQRVADHLCINCHTGSAPRLAPGERSRFAAPGETGIECRRCHGDGEAHCLSGDPLDIVNPARLDPQRQDEVCAQCHLSAALEIVRPGAALDEYVPGTPLGAVYGVFATQAEHVSEGISISGHGARLRSSRCAAASADLTCTTCHDPHPTGTRPSEPNDGCALCHDTDHCGLEPAERTDATCSSCHMPKVASSDIAHTRTTDHRIRVVTAEEAGTAPPRPEEIFVGAQAVADRPLVNLLDVQGELPGADLLLGVAYVRGYAAARDVLGREAPGYVKRAIELLDPLRQSGDPDTLQWVGSAYLLAGRARDAAEVLDAALKQRPDWPEALAERAYAERMLRPAWDFAELLAARGRPADALDVLLETRRLTGPELHRARAASRIAWDSGLVEKGLVFWLDRVVFRPYDAAELTVAGEALERVGRLAQAQSLAERAVAEDPDDGRAGALLRRTRARRGR